MDRLDVVQLGEREWAWACAPCQLGSADTWADEEGAEVAARRHAALAHPDERRLLLVHPVEAA